MRVCLYVLVSYGWADFDDIWYRGSVVDWTKLDLHMSYFSSASLNEGNVLEEAASNS